MKLFPLFFLAGIVLTAQEAKIKSMEDWEYPHPVKKQLVLDSIEIAYVEKGTGEQTLIFVHGLGSYLKAWNKNIESLSNEYRCIALDLPGYGKSSKGDYEYNMNFFADAVLDFVRALQLKNVSIVGHSMGGQISIHAVLEQPDVFNQLILIAPAGFETFTEQERAWFEAVYTAAFIKATPEAQIVKNFQINFYEMPEDAKFMIEDRLYMRQTIEYERYCEMIPKCVQGMLKQPVFERLKEIKLPTLVIYGEEDGLIPNKFLHPTLTTQSVAESGANGIPNSQIEIFKEAGHFVQWEQSEWVNQAVRSFLKK